MSAFSDLLHFTEAFDNAAWLKAGISGGAAPTVTANTVLDPNGILTDADSLNFPLYTAGQSGELFQFTGGTLPVTNRSFTFSIWLKVPSGTATITLGLTDNVFESASATRTVTSAWQRFNFSYTFVGPTNSGFVVPQIVYGPGAAQVVHAWGAQLDRGTSPLGYGGLWGNGFADIRNNAASGSKTLDLFLNLPPQRVFAAGDYIQTGTGTTQRLYKVLTDTFTDVSGNCTVDIFPRVREAITAPQAIYWFDTRGTFRLQDNLRSWDIDEALIYGIQFKAIEAF